MQQDFPSATVVGSHVRSLSSALVGDDYEIAIWLPPSYATSARRYPALYLLDAPLLFGLAVPIVLGEIWEGAVPELLIVGIGKRIQSLEEWWPIRGRDYAPRPLPSQPDSGHGATFLRFVREELVPYIDAHFRSEPTDRTFWGHSLGGTCVLSALFTMPGIFQRYIATSPAVVHEGEPLVTADGDWPPTDALLPARLFVSVGSRDETYGPHIEAFIANLQARRYPGLALETARLEEYGHITAMPLGFMRGLQAVFSSKEAVD